MSKKPGIRIRDKDKQEIAKLNKSLKAKQKRLSTKFGVDLDIEVKGIGDFETRKQFNAYKNQVKQATDYNAHRYVKNRDDVVIPYSEVKAIEREIKRVNKIKEKEWKKVKGKQFTDRGVPSPLTVEGQRAIMGDTRYAGFKGLKFNVDRFRSKKEFDEYKEQLTKTYKGDFLKRRNKRYKDNFLTALENVFGHDAKQIREIVQGMSDKDFAKLSLTENLGNLNFIYEKAQRDVKLRALGSVFGI